MTPSPRPSPRGERENCTQVSSLLSLSRFRQREGPAAHQGRGRVGGALGPCRLGNRFEDAHYVSKHFMIPEPQDAISLLGQLGVPPGIGFGLDGVLATVDLNDEIVLKTDEIDDVSAKHVLAAEL